MLTASVALDRAFAVGPVRPEQFGGFLEQMGRGVYGGIYEPGHPTADDRGFRGDVLTLLRELGITTVRYPGGNFVSGYRWEDSIGPVGSRQPSLDLAWRSIEPNTFGIDEFMPWVRALGAEPMLAVNLGTRGVAEALDVLEYCNFPGGTRLSDLRRANGADKPYGIRTWYLGNEMDGPWQIGQKTALEYGKLASQVALAMRQLDPELVLVACGSSSSDLPWFGEWERVVLSETYDAVDYISAHQYYNEGDGDRESFLASGEHLDRYLKDVIATADHVRAVGKHSKRMPISLDEWNVWSQRGPEAEPAGSEWTVGPPRLEDRYTTADAVVVGSLLITLLNNADRVHAANIAQLVNVIGPIMTETGGRAWRQTTFHPFSLTAAGARGTVLGVAVESPRHETAKHGEVDTVQAASTWDDSTGHGRVFLVNRSLRDEVEVTVDVRDLPVRGATAVGIGGPDLDGVATADDEARFAPAAVDGVRVEGGRVTLRLPRASWTSVALFSEDSK